MRWFVLWLLAMPFYTQNYYTNPIHLKNTWISFTIALRLQFSHSFLSSSFGKHWSCTISSISWKKLFKNVSAINDYAVQCACRMNKGFIFAVSGITHLQQRMIYGEASEKIQKLMGNVHLGLVKVIPLFCTLPSFVISFTTYFVTDLGNDAFQLPYRMW